MDQGILVTALKMVIGLGVVLLMFGGGILIARKFASRSQGFMRKTLRAKVKPIEILAQQSLGPGRGIYMVRCLDQKILIGATGQNISLLTTIEASSLDEDTPATESNDGFESSLKEKSSDDVHMKNNFANQLLKKISRV